LYRFSEKENGCKEEYWSGLMNAVHQEYTILNVMKKTLFPSEDGYPVVCVRLQTTIVHEFLTHADKYRGLDQISRRTPKRFSGTPIKRYYRNGDFIE
jgi:hypothetical protein